MTSRAIAVVLALAAFSPRAEAESALEKQLRAENALLVNQVSALQTQLAAATRKSAGDGAQSSLLKTQNSKLQSDLSARPPPVELPATTAFIASTKAQLDLAARRGANHTETLKRIDDTVRAGFRRQNWAMVAYGAGLILILIISTSISSRLSTNYAIRQTKKGHID